MMHIVLKVSLWTIGIIAVIVIACFSWLYFKSKLPELDITPNASLSEKVSAADSWLKTIQKSQHFNGAVLIVKNDSIVLKNTYGFTNGTQTESLSTHSMFRLASLSKQFTAFGIMVLQEKGRLHFDDTITRYLPNLPYKTVTIRHLLNHTSGIPDVYMDFPKTHATQVGDVLTNTKVVEILEQEQFPLLQPPNTVYRYSNTGYVLLSAIIEAITTRSFEYFMQTEVFKPLQLHETRVWNRLSKTPNFKHKTESFYNFLGEIEPLKPGVLDGVTGDGSIFSSINDMAKWHFIWYNNPLVSQQTIAEAFQPATLNNGNTSNYGFGWVLFPKRNAQMHNGSWLGARTLIVRNATTKHAIILLDNSGSLKLDAISGQLLKVLQ